jgi:hypothetical protein
MFLLQRRFPTVRAFAPVLFALFALGVNAEVEWSDEEARALASELAASVEALLEDAGTTQWQGSAVQQRKHEAALVDLKQMSRMANDLSRKLAAGQGHDQTAPLFRQILLQRDAVRFYAQNSKVPASTRATVERADTTLGKLELLYQAM